MKLHNGRADIFEKYKKVVFSVTNFYLDNPSDREDVFQETWLNVFKNMKSFDARSKLSTWIYSVAKNTALNFRRKKKPVTLEEEPATKKSALDDSVIKKLDIQQAMDKLSASEQEVIFLHYSQDYSYQEMAEKLGLNVSTVKSRLFEARKKMRVFLAR